MRRGIEVGGCMGWAFLWERGLFSADSHWQKPEVLYFLTE